MTENLRSIALTVNGEDIRETVEVRTSLVDFLRERLGLTGSHVGCEQGVCGACTVRLDGVTVRGCLVLAVQCAGSRVETIEGVSDAGEIADLQDAFVRRNALQCGFCTPGVLLSAQELLASRAQAGGRMLSRDEIRAHLSGSYCRCTGYQAIVDAIEAVAMARLLGPRASRPLPIERAGGETVYKDGGASSPPPTEVGPARLRSLDEVAEPSLERGSAGGRSARASGPGGGDSASAYTVSPSSPAPPPPHPGSPSAIRPSPFRGGWGPPLHEERAGRPRSQGVP
jgi:carbon-monoxide dehydrogenase small subunit